MIPKNKRALVLMGLAVAGWMVGCGPSVAVSTSASINSPMLEPTTTGTNTHTPVGGIPSSTPSITPTPVQATDLTPAEYPTRFPPGFSPTPRPTPTNGLPATATAAPEETCPQLTHEPMEVRVMDYPMDYEHPILDYLSANGEIQTYIQRLEALDMEQHDSAVPITVHMEVVVQDVTGDGVNEFLIEITGNGRFDILEDSDPERPVLFIFGCREGQYQIIHMIRTRSTMDILTVADLNADGIWEITYSWINNIGAKHGRFTFAIQVLRWNGEEFRELLLDPYRYPSSALSPTFEDLDGNGTVEILIPQYSWWEQDGGVDCDIGPSLNFDEIWMWDGEYYHYMWRQYAAPIYRFQAAFMGDYDVSLGLYDKSENLYLRAVFDQSLKPGSRGDWMRDGECYGADDFSPDPDEPERMKAYARLRLVELYVHVGRVNEAEWHRSYMRTNHSVGTPGYIYAYLANAFWWGYADSEDISVACARVIEEAEAYEEDVFGPFEQYGFQNSGSTLTDICPFTAPPAE